MSPTRRASAITGLRAAVAAGQPQAEPPKVGEGSTKPQVPPAKVETVHFSLHLPKPMHRYLRRFALDADTDASVVVRALLTEMQLDDELAEKVRSRISDSDV
jgi:hypothetical protein